MASEERSVLFVCLGNICRSPMAESLFKDIVRKSGSSCSWKVDSAGSVDWNEGSRPDKMVVQVLTEHSVPVGDHRARKIEMTDFYDFDFIFSMDEAVMRDLVRQKPKDSKSKVELLRRYDPKQEVFKDPYCGTKAEFEKVFRQSEVCLKHFLEEICREPYS